MNSILYFNKDNANLYIFRIVTNLSLQLRTYNMTLNVVSIRTELQQTLIKHFFSFFDKSALKMSERGQTREIKIKKNPKKKRKEEKRKDKRLLGGKKVRRN